MTAEDPLHTRRLDLATATIWTVALAVVAVLLELGHVPAYAWSVYAEAARAFGAGAPLYADPAERGFQYFPQAALLAAPFAALPDPWDGLLWRGAGWGLYATGVDRLARAMAPALPARAALVAALVAVGPAVGSLGNGQANLPVAGLTLHASLALGERRWWRGAGVLALAVALKPIALAHALTAGAVTPALWWRLPLGFAAVAVAPFLVAAPDYVLGELQGLAAKLRDAARPEDVYEDIRGLVRAASGVVVPHEVARVVRGLAALAVVGVAGVAGARRSPFVAQTLIGGLAASWVVLLSPQSQPTYYVLPAGFAAALAARAVGHGDPRGAMGWALFTLPWTVSHHAIPAVEHWMKPASALLFAGALVASALRRAPGRDPSVSGPRSPSGTEAKG